MLLPSTVATKAEDIRIARSSHAPSCAVGEHVLTTEESLKSLLYPREGNSCVAQPWVGNRAEANPLYHLRTSPSNP